MREGLEAVGGGLEDRRVGPERDDGAGLAGGLALGEVGGGPGELVALPPHVAVGADLDVQGSGQRVDDGEADTVQAAGDGVGLAVELAARVQGGQDEFDRRALLDRVQADRDAAAVVGDADAAVGREGDLDGVGVAGEGLVDGVVDDLVHQVVQAPLAGGADVHARALTYRFEPFENCDRSSVVGQVETPSC
jgi:hypothetical protein